MVLSPDNNCWDSFLSLLLQLEKIKSKKGKTVKMKIKESRIAKKLLKAHLPKGQVKCKQYLDYLMNARCAEFNLRDQGVRVVHKSIEEIRAEFESKFGSIYINI